LAAECWAVVDFYGIQLASRVCAMLFPILAEWDWTGPKLPFDEWWFFGVVLVVLVVFIWVIARLLMPTTDDVDPAEVDRQMLTAVNELRSQGELTQEEFRSIKSRLVKRLSTETGSKDSLEKTEDSENGDSETHRGNEKCKIVIASELCPDVDQPKFDEVLEE